VNFGRWLDLRALSGSLIAAHSQWAGAVVESVTYCTAGISGNSPDEQVSVHEQDVYLRALAGAHTRRATATRADRHPGCLQRVAHRGLGDAEPGADLCLGDPSG
jgi:hypothetical protein